MYELLLLCHVENKKMRVSKGLGCNRDSNSIVVSSFNQCWIQFRN